MSRRKRHLLLIDGQDSFARQVGDQKDPVRAYQEQQKLHRGELCVPGGWEALVNVADMINLHGNQFDDMTFTFDCHQLLHIAHAIWFRWMSKPKEAFITVDGRNVPTYQEMNVRGQLAYGPSPFTTMVEENGAIFNGVLDCKGNLHKIGQIQCTHLGFTSWTTSYLRKLRESGRYPHMIWPNHCLIGTDGNRLIEPIQDAMFAWEQREFGVVNKITKGSNMKTEHFGAVHAEVEDPDDVATKVNTHFIGLLSDPDQEIVICGLARGHCLANTARDIAAQFPDPDSFIKRLVLLKDGTADVPGLEFLGDNFVNEFQPRGMQVTTCKEYFGSSVLV